MKHTKQTILIGLIMVATACAGRQGDQGYQGIQGNTGIQGLEGQQGTPGTNGTDGTNATPVTVVNFCPGVTTYPTTFLEVGFCINNQLYAVYSENNGFLVLVPPGVYRSNAHGNSCNFTVYTNCVVTH